VNRIQITIALKLALLAVLIFKTPDALAGVFKCTGADGRISYQSRPCNSDNVQAEIKLRKSVTNYANSASENSTKKQKTASTVTTPSVVLYSTDWCGYCTKVRQLFDENKIAYKEFDIEKSAKAKREYDKLNGKGVPLTKIDKTLVSGYNPQRLLSLAQP